jgi:teichuronic acid biosynthesis glycosyltransferase TuaC
MRILMITSEWPTSKQPYAVPFIVRQVDQLRRAGLEVDVFHFEGRKNPFRYLFAWVRLRTRFKLRKYDLIHAQWGQSAILALPKKKPLVITYRGSDLDGILTKLGRLSIFGRILRLVSKYLANIADQVIVVSEHLAEGLPDCSYLVIPTGIDMNLFNPREKTEARNLLGIPQNERIILFVGNPLNVEKRFELARSAVDLIKKSHSNVRLFVVNRISYEQMPLYMNMSDVLILTSAHEGSPNVVKEALACNLPVVSTDVGDVRKRLSSIEGCFICADDQPETIALALKQVLTRNERIKGRETIKDLDEDLLIRKVIVVYQNAISI